MPSDLAMDFAGFWYRFLFPPGLPFSGKFFWPITSAELSFTYQKKFFIQIGEKLWEELPNRQNAQKMLPA